MRFGKNAEFLAGFFLAADINFRCRVISHADEREAGSHAALFQFTDARGEFALDLRGDGAAGNEIVRRHHSTTWIFWMVITGVFFQRSAMPSSPVTMMCRPL